MRRSGDVHDIDTRHGNELTMVMEGFHPSADLLFRIEQVAAIDVTYRDDTRTGISHVPHTHPPDTDDAFGELVAWRYEAPADHMARDDEETCCDGRPLVQEPSP